MLAIPEKDSDRQVVRRVLIVEDEAIARQALGRLLSREGYEIESAGSAEEALSHPDDPLPAIALIDVDLPGMNGVELAAQLRRKRPDSVCIFITSWPVDQLPRKPRVGNCRYLQKPINFPRLLDLLNQTNQKPH